MEERSERDWKKKFPFLFIFNWVLSVCTFNITLRGPERKAIESLHLLPSQGLESRLMALFWVLSEVVGLLRRLDPIPYLVKRQDAAVAWTTFYTVAGLKSLANHQLKLYHTPFNVLFAETFTLTTRPLRSGIADQTYGLLLKTATLDEATPPSV